MSTTAEKAKRLIQLFNRIKPFDQVLEDVVIGDELEKEAIKIPGPISWSEDAKQQRIEFLKEQTGAELPVLTGVHPIPNCENFQGNIEHYIGMTQIPTGIIGPMQVNGSLAQGDFYVPLATSEGALVASYNRGARATKLSGGIVSVCLTEGVQRAPIFKFLNLNEVGKFMQWTLTQLDEFRNVVSQNSRYAVLEDMRINMEGNTVMLILEYTTGEAAGQNMVTICTEAICQYILQHTPIQPRYWFIESNYSGDKKATVVSFSNVRGKKVTAEALIRKEVIKSVLGTTAKDIAEYWQTSSIANVQSGSIGVQGHFANGLTAIFLACGQDAACVAESYVGITRMQVENDHDLYVSVTLPSLIVGTVGGGTGLPTQRECLNLLGCSGPNSARKFAEICGATVLCGELSIAAAMASGNFSKAHKLFGRKK